ncbi:uncharacterized protein [Cherax quadricarinatus]|uniref:uncharacterized protein n=1 Tax=Cherax quadricarinatus TaxID=27406 RepID=UPI00237869F5|nr:uncharacterized protein LOC128696753 [Cherax quadricarinatus]
MISQALVSCVFLCACAVRAVPQTYGILEVQEPLPNTETGPYANVVDAVIEILPDIADVFEKITRSRDPSSDPADFKVIQDIILSFLPITEKIMRAAAKADGREVKPEELERLARVSKVLPDYFRLIEDITTKDLAGISDLAAKDSGISTASSSAHR